MKKFLSMGLVVILVLAMGAMAFAAEGNPETKELKAEINVTAKIGPYAQVIGARPVDFGVLEGKVGIYTANGFDGNSNDPDDQFYGRVWNELSPKPAFAGNNNTGWGSFFVESNTDVSVKVQFDSTGWLVSPTKFAVAMRGKPDDVIAWFDTTEAGFIHAYTDHSSPNNKDPMYPTAVQYGIDGAIWLQHISQQEARWGEDDYTGKITITVSK